MYFAGGVHLTDQKLHDRYGPVVRIGPNSLLFSDLAAYQSIYGFQSKVEKGDFYALAGSPDPQKHNIFQCQTDDQHRDRARKVVSVAVGALRYPHAPSTNNC